MKKIGYAMAFLTIVFFSTNEFASKFVSPEVSPMAVSGFRFLVGSIVLAPAAIISYRKRNRSFAPRDYFNMIYTGVLNVTVSMTFLQFAVYFGKASVSGILVATNPIFVTIFAAYLLKEKITFPKILAIVLGVLGIALIIGFDDKAFGSSRNFALGAFFGMLSAVTFALYTVLSKRFVKSYGNSVFNAVSFFAGAVTALAICVFMGFGVNIFVDAQSFWSIIYLGVFVCGVGYILFMEALKRIPASDASMFFFLKPAFATVLALFFLDESVTTLQVVGIVIVCASLLIEHLRTKIVGTNSQTK